MNINSVIHEILADEHKTHSKYLSKYPEFSSNYPTLFDKLFEPKFDKSILLNMMDQKQQIDSNLLSQHDASVKVGELLVNKYVKPLLDN